MTALAVQLADAIVAELNDATFGQAFTATRAYRPFYELSDMETLRVTVVSATFDASTLTRAGDREECGVDIAVQKKVNVDDTDAVDPLMNLLEEIGLHFRRKTMATTRPATCVRRETIKGAEAGYAPEHIETLRQFTGIMRLTFAVGR